MTSSSSPAASNSSSRADWRQWRLALALPELALFRQVMEAYRWAALERLARPGSDVPYCRGIIHALDFLLDDARLDAAAKDLLQLPDEPPAPPPDYQRRERFI